VGSEPKDASIFYQNMKLFRTSGEPFSIFYKFEAVLSLFVTNDFLFLMIKNLQSFSALTLAICFSFLM